MRVDADYLSAVFEQIDRDYGSMETYLDQRLGVDADDIRRLRALYTEQAHRRSDRYAGQA
jgi:protein tyrosine/serine phosphatase